MPFDDSRNLQVRSTSQFLAALALAAQGEGAGNMLGFGGCPGDTSSHQQLKQSIEQRCAGSV